MPPRKKARTVAICDFNRFRKECIENIEFLNFAFHQEQQRLLENDIVLQYAVINALIRLGEALTFLRDDPNHYKDEHQRHNYRGGLNHASTELRTLTNFVYIRNQLLHHNIYNNSFSARKDDLKTLLTRAQKGYRGPTGIQALDGLLTKAASDNPQQLSKEVGGPQDLTGQSMTVLRHWKLKRLI